MERFWSKVNVGDWQDCWLWTAARGHDGYGNFYGRFHFEGKVRRAHRVAYELLVGPIPEGLVLDHVKAWGCTDTLCVNPLHLEPVTQTENIQRGGWAARSHCGCGELLPEAMNEQGRRRCLACKNRYKRTWRARVRARGGRPS